MENVVGEQGLAPQQLFNNFDIFDMLFSISGIR